MKAMKFQQDEYIYRKGSPIDEIFFVVKGLFGFVLSDYEEVVFVNIHANDYFGDIDYVFKDNDGKRQFTVRSLENSEVYTLCK